MIVVLGASGYIGEAFVHELKRRGAPFMTLSRSQVDYARFDSLLKFLREKRPSFLVNAAGYTGRPNVDACETAKADTLAGCVLLPQTIAHACDVAGVPWGHVSSGCLYSGAKIVTGGETRVEKDMTRPELRALAEKSPESIHGFTEEDAPNFSFREPPCSFYSGSKALAEEMIANIGQHYSWRLRIPFDEADNARNYLSKVQRYSKVYDNVNSISHRGEFAKACLDLWERRAPFGIYNVTNPGFVTTRHVVELVEEVLRPGRAFEFWKNDEEFYRVAKTPRSNCVLDVSKLLATGVKIRPVEEALEESLRQWKPENKTIVNSPA
ncbi:MAG TPA: sugar nucleotide-binding protein [Candidatus Polarisedimenticolia bacterium]|nr:sugar nucleotide-binding protein [Candidatus Polarisedimenticolia bacterium]